jgi:hypothetical protein
VSTWRLTSDGSLTIAGDGPTFRSWLPRSAVISPKGAAHLDLLTPLGLIPPDGPATLSLLEVSAWIEGDAVWFRDEEGARDGTLDLPGKRGTVGAEPDAYLEPILTIATALLLGRLGRALVHSAAVVAPDGGAWLLIGDTHAGKSTTVATLVRGGWGWLADDQVVLSGEDGEVRVEGWPRDVNLDAGYIAGSVTGRRIGVAMKELGVAPATGGHPLRGLLLPHVAPDAPTRLAAASAADGFAALVRQSPWLLADPAAAVGVHRLLTLAASTRVARLSLGRDSYGRGELLAGVLRSLTE